MDQHTHQSGRAKGTSPSRRVITRQACQEVIQPPDASVVKGYFGDLLGDVMDKLPSVYRRADFRRDWDTFQRRLDHEGVLFATARLPIIFDGLVTILEGGVASFPGFKTTKRKGHVHPVFLGGLAICILDHPGTDVGRLAMEALYQLSYAFKKVIGPYNNLALSKQLAEFKEVDYELKFFDYLSEPLRAITDHAREIVTQICAGLNPFDPTQVEQFLPRPGPGATNTPLPKSERFTLHSGYQNLTDVFDVREWFEPPFAPPRNFNIDWGGVVSRNVIRSDKRPAQSGELIQDAATSRFRFVPKTNQKARGICIEENEVQWLQQALRSALVSRIESHPLTKGYVNFTSQQINRQLALTASATKEKATLDMSSASDRISRALVSFLFGRNKPLLDAILAVSTETVELPDLGSGYVESFPINKIAPMGSAICFPIMALVHFSLIKAILRFSSVPRDKISEVYVYGDDIIVNRECVDAIYDYLPLYGMKFNTEKSFTHSHFRESCGLHAYEGHEVTPVRFKTAYNHLRTSDVPGLLRLEKAFYDKGYRRTAQRIRIAVQRWGIDNGIKYFYPVDPSSPLFGFYRDEASLDEFVKNVDGKRHRNIANRPWYDCQVYTVPVIADYKVESPPLVGAPGYLKWLVTGSESAKFVEDCPADKKFVRWKTLPESALGFKHGSADAAIPRKRESWLGLRGYDW